MSGNLMATALRNLIEQFDAYRGGWLGKEAWRDRVGLGADLESARAALMAELPAPPSAQAPEWRPIETAPRDGTTVIVARHMGDFGWIRGCAMWVGGNGFVAGWVSHGFDRVMGELGLAHPTHWQPLPAPPKEVV